MFSIAFPNRFANSPTVGGQGWTSSLPVTNLTTRQLSQTARSHFAMSKFFATFSSAQAASLLALAGHNGTMAAQWRVRGYSSDPRAQIDRSTQVAVCDIDLAGGFPASSVSCTRSTTGTYFDSSLVLRTAAINTPRFTYDPNTGVALGLLVESTVTNMLLWSRDFTNAAWTKTNMTTAQTATGADGVANSATRLTATAGNATVTQTVVIAGAAYASVLARRVSGTGTVQLSGDNFTTTTNMVLTSSWKRFWIACSTGTETFGVKIVTNGDVIELDFAQFEGGASISAAVTSPIPTTSATVQRISDNISISIPAHLRPTAASGSWVAEIRFLGRANSGMSYLSINGTAAMTIQHDGAGNLENTYSGTATRRHAAVTVDSDFTLAVNYANAAHDARYNGNTSTVLANPATAANTLSSITANPAYAGFALRRLTFFSSTQDAGTLTTFSTAFTPPAAGYDSGLVDVWPAAFVSAASTEQETGQRYPANISAPAVPSYLYWRVDWSDATNADGYNDLGRMFMGTDWEPDTGMIQGAQIGFIDRNKAEEADDGAEFFDENDSPRYAEFNVEGQTEEQAMLTIFEMQRQLGSTKEVLFKWDVTDTTLAPTRTWLGRLQQLSPLVCLVNRMWTAKFRVKELL